MNPLQINRLVPAGEAPRETTLATGELAVYTAVAGLILNLDEAVTKQ